MTIEISKKEIFDEVEKRSALEGRVLPERFDGVWASEDEGVFLDSYWVECCSAVVELFKRYLKGATFEHELGKHDKDEVLSLVAQMPVRYNFALDGIVLTELKMMMACNVLYRWLSVVQPEAAQKYDDESKGYMESVRTKLLYRDEPRWQKPKNRGMRDDVFIERG